MLKAMVRAALRTWTTARARTTAEKANIVRQCRGQAIDGGPTARPIIIASVVSASIINGFISTKAETAGPLTIPSRSSNQGTPA